MKKKLAAVLLVVAFVLSFGLMPAFAGDGIQVAVDIKPQSCPNPINVVGKGVLPVAILGTEDFDVTQVDPATVKVILEGVTPLRWALEDVATPYSDDLCGCHEDGPDGFLDLTLKFDMQELVRVLGTVSDGEVRPLILTGNLMDGTPIWGTDCVVIRAR